MNGHRGGISCFGGGLESLCFGRLACCVKCDGDAITGCAASMIRVWGISGDELAAIPMEALKP